MPAGVETIIEDGFATITFTDPTLRGPALAALIADVGPELVDVDTSGTRKSYIVPASAAEKAGLLDVPAKPKAKKAAAKAAPKVEPEPTPEVEPVAEPAAEVEPEQAADTDDGNWG
jgi:hypothetical protein